MWYSIIIRVYTDTYTCTPNVYTNHTWLCVLNRDLWTRRLRNGGIQEIVDEGTSYFCAAYLSHVVCKPEHTNCSVWSINLACEIQFHISDSGHKCDGLHTLSLVPTKVKLKSLDHPSQLHYPSCSGSIVLAVTVHV